MRHVRRYEDSESEFYRMNTQHRVLCVSLWMGYRKGNLNLNWFSVATTSGELDLFSSEVVYYWITDLAMVWWIFFIFCPSGFGRGWGGRDEWLRESVNLITRCWWWQWIRYLHTFRIWQPVSACRSTWGGTSGLPGSLIKLFRNRPRQASICSASSWGNQRGGGKWEIGQLSVQGEGPRDVRRIWTTYALCRDCLAEGG